MRNATESLVENASLSIFAGKQSRLVERFSRVMKRGNTGARVRWDTTRKETNCRSGKENGRSNASCFSKVGCAGERKSMGYIAAEVE